MRKLILCYFALANFFCAASIAAKPKCGETRKITGKDTLVVTVECYKEGDWSITRMLNGKLDGLQENYYVNGQKRSESYFKNEQQIGIQKGWKPDGFLSVYRPYRSGHPIDTHKVWYANKKMQTLDVYDTAGERNGWSMKWYENGKLSDSILWSHGNKLEEHLFYPSGLPMARNCMKYDSANVGKIVSSITWDRAGKKNGDVKNGNGISILPQHATGPDTLYYDTLYIKTVKL